MPRRSAAIFDIGGVLTTSPVASIRAFCQREGLPHDVIGPLLALPHGTWSRFEKSELSQEEFVPLFESECSERGVALKGVDFLAAFFQELVVRDEMLAVVRHLKGKVRLGCITNNVARDDSRPSPLVDLHSLFEVVIESAKTGMRKPDPRIYLHTCEELGVKPADCVFLDDFGVNLKAARELGMATIKVDETDSAIDELEEILGLPLPRPA